MGRFTGEDSKLRVLMQMRPNALVERGGDTVVMERLTEGLRKLGHHADIDLNGERNPADYDIVHLYNFCTVEITERFARRCVESKTPYVVTTMYEDWPFFFNSMIAHFVLLEKYVQLGQPRQAWADLKKRIENITPAAIQANYFTAEHAGALIGTGENEVKSILRDYPNTRRAEIYYCGSQVGAPGDGGELFRQTFGVSDYVLCVGRLETRKNQLMLLKALEDSDLTLVFAAGGFTYQPDYEAVCRRFKRKGKTIYLGKIDAQLLASAFSGTRAHVLPSFYELPGLVSIEAAHYGANCVVTDYGTIRDYLGDDAYYCVPGCHESILDAVNRAYQAPRNPNISERVKPFTWENAVLRNLEIYQAVLADSPRSIGSSPAGFSPGAAERLATKSIQQIPQYVAQAQAEVTAIPSGIIQTNHAGNGDVYMATELCSQGDILMRGGKTTEALGAYNDAVQVAPGFARAYRSSGVAALLQGRYDDAESAFRQAVALDPRDAKAVAGVGSALWGQNEKEAGFKAYLEASLLSPQDISVILHVINGAYELNRLAELEQVLLRYLETNPNNTEMNFCLSGCYYKQEKLFLCALTLDNLRRTAPDYAPALELEAALAEKRRVVSHGVAASSTVETKSATPTPVKAEVNQPRVIVQPPGISAVQHELLALEDQYRRKEYRNVLEKISEILTRQALSSEDRSRAMVLKAESLASLGQLEEADALFKEIEKSATHSYRGTAGRGVVAAARGQWSEAEQLFKDSLARRPEHDVAIAGLGMCALQKSNPEAAWNYFTQALDRNPENIRSLLGLIQLAYPLNRLPELERALAAYLDFNPGNLSLVYSYAGCLYAQEKLEEAATQLEKILVFEPEHLLAQELLTRIRSGISAVGRARA